jgi:single-strand DNA-binding protein
MNKISVIGRVSQDVEVKNINGRNVANFNVASQNKNKTGEENGRAVYGTNFYRVSAWSQAADTASRYLKKGHRVGITGDLVIRDYTGSDGLKHTVVEINNAEIDLIETRAESEAKAQAAAGVTSVNRAVPAAQAPANPGFTPVEFDEGLPF